MSSTPTATTAPRSTADPTPALVSGQQRGRQQGRRHRTPRRKAGTRPPQQRRRAIDTGLFFFDLHDSLISKNSATGNRDGIDLTGGQHGSEGNRLTSNTANRNAVLQGSASSATRTTTSSAGTWRTRTAARRTTARGHPRRGEHGQPAHRERGELEPRQRDLVRRGEAPAKRLGTPSRPIRPTRTAVTGSTPPPARSTEGENRASGNATILPRVNVICSGG